MVEADLLLRGGYVVPQERMGQVIEDGAVAIRGNRIVDVGAAAEVGARVRAARTIESFSEIAQLLFHQEAAHGGLQHPRDRLGAGVGAVGRPEGVVDVEVTERGEPAGELNWSMRGERRAITHTGVRGQFRNKGLAALLMKRAMDDAASEAVTVVPLCSYAVDYLARTPGYEDSIG